MPDWPRVEKFESASIVLPVINEAVSLKGTVEIILRDVKDRVKEIIVVVCKKTTPEAMAAAEELRGRLGGPDRRSPAAIAVPRRRAPRRLRRRPGQPRGDDGQRPGNRPERPAGPARRSGAESIGGGDGDALAARRRLPRILARQARVQLDLPAILLSALHDPPDGHDVRIPGSADEARPGHSMGGGAAPVQPGEHCEASAAGRSRAGSFQRLEGPRRRRVAESLFSGNFAYFRPGLKARFARKESFLKPVASPPAPAEGPRASS